MSRFIGRQRELVEVKRLLASARLVTLVGLGGCGKTRLAIEVARDLAGSYAGGVGLVELAALTNPSFVPETVASAMGICEESCCIIDETLVRFFSSKRLLLVLDNCEHLIEACARLAETLLQACPQLVILATSREPLGISGEHLFPLSPFSLPESQTQLSVAEMQQSEAVQLFVDRAAAVRAGFELTDENSGAVMQICQKLDGIPLALELAAARLRTLSLEQIVDRLDDRFGLLTLGSRTALPRQQTLRGAVDWSYDLLAEKERRLLRGLAVFHGGWDLEAVEAVCGEDGVISSTEVLDLLAQLANKSLLLVSERGGQARYRMLETIRQYAFDRLVDEIEMERACNRHLVHFSLLMEEASPHLYGPEQLEWFARLEADFANLRAAMQWSLNEIGPGAKARAEMGLRLAAASQRFWMMKDFQTEGGIWFDRILANNPDPSPAVKSAQARALGAAGYLAVMRKELEKADVLSRESLALFCELGDEGGAGFATLNLAIEAFHREDYPQAKRLAEESAALLRKAGDPANLALALDVIGNAAMRLVEYGQANDLFQQALAIAQEIGDLMTTAAILQDISHVAQFQGDFERAVPLLEENLALLRQLKSKWLGIPYTLALLGQVALHQRDYARAEARCKESLGLLQELGLIGRIDWPLDLLGIAACRQGKYEQASDYFQQALTANQRFAHRQGIAENLAGFGAVALGWGRSEAGVRLLGAADAQIRAIGTDFGPADGELLRQSLELAHARLDADAFAQAWAAGRELTPDEAVNFALAQMAQPPAESPAGRMRSSLHEPGGLTPRERQVAALVTRGMSNREIASELVLSERTVENHLANIFSRLGFNSRAQVAAWGVENGLGGSTDVTA